MSVFKSLLGSVFKRKEKLPANEYIKQCIAEKGRIELIDETNKNLTEPLLCSVADYSDNYLILEARTEVEVDSKWIGREVECFFRVRSNDPNHKWQFFSFQTKINGTTIDKRTNNRIFTLTSPKVVMPTQRRRFVRVKPPDKFFVDILVWPEMRSSVPIEQLGKPVFMIMRGDKFSRLVDLSAGGMKLEVEHFTISKTSIPLKVNSVWFLRISLYDPSKKANTQWWLKAKVLYAEKSRVDPRSMFMRLMFLYEAETPAAKETFKWKRVPSEKGVTDIYTWVFRRGKDAYLDQQARDKGQD